MPPSSTVLPQQCWHPSVCVRNNSNTHTNTQTHKHTQTQTKTINKHKNCEQNTLTRHIFSCFTALISMSHVTLAQGSRCLARITSCHHAFGCAFDLILFDPLLCTLHHLSHLLFMLLFFTFIFHVGWFSEKSHAYSRE